MLVIYFLFYSILVNKKNFTSFTDNNMEVEYTQHTASPVKRMISVIPEDFERLPELEFTASRLSRNESRAMMSRALSRNLTRASLKIPPFVGGRSSKTIVVDLPTKPQFDLDDDYDFDFESDEGTHSPPPPPSTRPFLRMVTKSALIKIILLRKKGFFLPGR